MSDNESVATGCELHAHREPCSTAFQGPLGLRWMQWKGDNAYFVWAPISSVWEPDIHVRVVVVSLLRFCSILFVSAVEIKIDAVPDGGTC